MIPKKLAERIREMGEDPEKIYNIRARKAFLGTGSEKVPWFPDAVYDGSGYKFDPVSAVPVIALEPGKNEKILDMCAAPGTKTILIAHITNNSADITANDISRKRILRLRENLRNYKINAKITKISGRIIKDKFDKVLLDAPCSGEGLINKKEKMLSAWSERRIKFLAKKQKKLIANAFNILNNNGILVYSTCVFAPEENEDVVQYLLDKNENAEIENVNVNVNHSPGILEWKSRKFSEDMKKCMRIYPHQNGTGGFFVARIRKLHNQL